MDDLKSIRQNHTRTNHNRNSVLSYMESNLREQPESWEILTDISNELSEIDGATPRQLVRLLRSSGCKRPYALLYHSLFFTISTLLARKFENDLE